MTLTTRVLLTLTTRVLLTLTTRVLMTHVDEDVVEVSGGPCDPFDDDEEAEVSKDRVEEDHLGHKLAPHGQHVVAVEVVEEAHEDA